MSHDNAQKQTAIHETHAVVKDESQPETALPSLSMLMQRVSPGSNARRPELTAAGIMQLQRTVGNAATRRLIEPRSTANPTTLQRQIMSYKEFRTATGQVSTTTSLQESKEKGRFGRTRKVNKVVATEQVNLEQEDIFSGETGANALRQERYSQDMSPNRGDLRHAGTITANINQAFKVYDADQSKSLKNLIALYNTITYWQAANLNHPWVAASAGIIDALMKQIQTEVQARTLEMGGEKSVSAADSLAKPGSHRKAKMPDFLQEVGIAQGYFDEHIADNQPIIKSLESFYNNLKAGHLYQASKAWQAVSHLPGSYQIRGPFLAHFSSAANLGKIVNTDAKAQEGQELTAAEKAAIVNYSGTSYASINTALRGHNMRSTDKPVTIGNKHRIKQGPTLQADDKEQSAAQQRARAPKTLNMASQVLSGLNKLPKYAGRLYRVLTHPPEGFMKGVSPGGVLVDLGFSSASPSMNGVSICSRAPDGRLPLN